MKNNKQYYTTANGTSYELEGIIGDEYELDNLTNNFDTVIILE